MVKLGDQVIDSVSGFSGIAVSRTDFLNGCSRISVQPPVGKDGKLPDYATFDEPQLVLKKAGKVAVGSRLTGGPDKYMPKAREG